MESSTYAYCPLASATSIRMLRLEPASDRNAPLFASLEHIQLAQHLEYGTKAGREDQNTRRGTTLSPALMQYEAVSYAWGTQKHTSTLNFIGTMPPVIIKIRPNVDDMLRYLRSTTQQRCLWIDALCINQDDDTELDSQVNVMEAIYRQAKAITVWVGPPTGAEDGELRLFEDLVKYAQADNQYREQRADTWLKLRPFLNRRWFTRRWTIQEVVLGKQVTMLCGKHAINFMVFAKNAWLIAQQQPHFSSQLSGILRKLWMMYKLRSAFVPEVRTDALSLLIDFSSAECKKAHDRIYALRAITDVQIPVSYRDPLEAVFIHYAKAHVELGNLAILNCGGAFRPTDLPIPSWVPDWQKTPDYTPLATRIVTQNQDNQRMRQMAAARIRDGVGNILSLNGVKLGTVGRVASGASTPIWAGDILGLLQNWYAIFDSSVNKLARRHGSEERLANQFIATITMGAVAKRSNALSPDHPWLYDAHSEHTPGVSWILAHLIREVQGMNTASVWSNKHTPLKVGTSEAPVEEANTASGPDSTIPLGFPQMPRRAPVWKIHAALAKNGSNEIDFQATAAKLPEGLKAMLKNLTYGPPGPQSQYDLRYDANAVWGVDDVPLSNASVHAKNLQPNELVDVLCRTMMGRTCYWSTDGVFGLGPAKTEAGDVIVAIPTCPTPYVLRPVGEKTEKSRKSWFHGLGTSKDKAASDKQHTLVGDCYVHGFDSGAAFEGKHDLRTFLIV